MSNSSDDLFFIFTEILHKENESSQQNILQFDKSETTDPFDSQEKQFQDYLKSSEKGDESENQGPDLEDLKEYIKQEQRTKYTFADDDVTMMQGDDPTRYTNMYHDNTAEHTQDTNMDREKKGRGRGHRKKRQTEEQEP